MSKPSAFARLRTRELSAASMKDAMQAIKSGLDHEVQIRLLILSVKTGKLIQEVGKDFRIKDEDQAYRVLKAFFHRNANLKKYYVEKRIRPFLVHVEVKALAMDEVDEDRLDIPRA